MKTLEHDEQVTLMQWWALAHKQFENPIVYNFTACLDACDIKPIAEEGDEQ